MTKKIKTPIMSEANFRIEGLSQDEITHLLEKVILPYVEKKNGTLGGGFITITEEDDNFFSRLKVAIKDLYQWAILDIQDFTSRMWVV